MNLRVRAKCCCPKLSYWLLRGDRQVGLALAISGGGWQVWDTEETYAVCPRLFSSPKRAAEWAQQTGLAEDDPASPVPFEDEGE